MSAADLRGRRRMNAAASADYRLQSAESSFEVLPGSDTYLVLTLLDARAVDGRWILLRAGPWVRPVAEAKRYLTAVGVISRCDRAG
jgi:hypothetical protein